MISLTDKAKSLLNSGRISEAIAIIRKRLIADRNPRALDSLNQIERNYGFLLHYLSEGKEDAGRDHMISDIREQLYTIIRAIEYNLEIKESPKLYFSQARTIKYSGLNYNKSFSDYIAADSVSLLLDKESEEMREAYDEKNRRLRDLFSIVWTLPIGDTDTLRDIVDSISNPDVPEHFSALMISALTINLLMVYDRHKLMALVDIYLRTNSDLLKARLLTGILLILNQYSQRVENDYELKIRIETMSDTPQFSEKVNDILFSLVKARGGLNLSHRIEQEILPEITKIGPDLMNKLKDKDGNLNISNLEENPEWEKLMNDKVGKKLRKLNDLQSSGGDIMISMFAQLCDKFHRFNDIDMWFRPFTQWEARSINISERLTEVWSKLSGVASMCDLDKFVFAMNMSRLPESVREHMINAFDAQQEQMNEEIKSLMLRSSMPEFETESWNYARVLFRFFNFFRLKKEFPNPFEQRIDIFNVPFLGKFFDKAEMADELADFFFKQEFYADAIDYIDIQSSIDILNRPLHLQKIGYCLEKLDKKSEALKKYSESVDLGDDSLWTLKKIFKLGKETGEIESAFRAISQLLKAEPDNTLYLKDFLNFGVEYFEQLRPNLSQAFSKAGYLLADDDQIGRLKARYDFLCGNYVAAKEFYDARYADVQMYLAGKALTDAVKHMESEPETGGVGNENKSEISDGSDIIVDFSDTQNKLEEKKMAEDTLILAAINIMTGNSYDAILQIATIRMLQNPEISVDSLAHRLRMMVIQSKKHNNSGKTISRDEEKRLENLVNLHIDAARHSTLDPRL